MSIPIPAMRQVAAVAYIIFTDTERRELAEKARALGRKALGGLGTIVTPETLLRWRWTFVERRLSWSASHTRRTGGPGGSHGDRNRTWGYARIQGAMANLGHKLGRGTIRSILKDHGIEPGPERGKGTPWWAMR